LFLFFLLFIWVFPQQIKSQPVDAKQKKGCSCIESK
jgi:hypothetical protein